jgi:hypothetical protein
VSRILPLRPQAADYPAHLSPSSSAPAPHDTHLDSITSLIIFPISVTSLGRIPQVLLTVGRLFVFRVYCFVYLLKYSLPVLASRLSGYCYIVWYLSYVLPFMSFVLPNKCECCRFSSKNIHVYI